MIGLSFLLIFALYELFVSTELVRVSRGLFRLAAVVCLILMICSERVEVYVGAGLFFGMIVLVSIWSFRSEVQNDESQP